MHDVHPFDYRIDVAGVCATVARIEDHDLWNRRLGRAWAEALSGLPVSATVVEVGPGYGDKVARGLATLEFSGRIVLVEPTSAARNSARARYEQILRKAEIELHPAPLSDAATMPLTEVHDVVANHVLDDMLLWRAVSEAASTKLFTEMTRGSECEPVFVESWRAIEADPALLDVLAREVASEFAEYVRHVRPRRVIVNEYASWTHARGGLQSLYAHALRVLRYLEVRLRNDGFVVSGARVPNIPRDSTWLVMCDAASRSRFDDEAFESLLSVLR